MRLVLSSCVDVGVVFLVMKLLNGESSKVLKDRILQ